MTLGVGGGGAWDPQRVRQWPEQDAEDALLVIAHLSKKTGSGRSEY